MSEGCPVCGESLIMRTCRRCGTLMCESCTQPIIIPGKVTTHTSFRRSPILLCKDCYELLVLWLKGEAPCSVCSQVNDMDVCKKCHYKVKCQDIQSKPKQEQSPRVSQCDKCQIINMYSTLQVKYKELKSRNESEVL